LLGVLKITKIPQQAYVVQQESVPVVQQIDSPYMAPVMPPMYTTTPVY